MAAGFASGRPTGVSSTSTPFSLSAAISIWDAAISLYVDTPPEDSTAAAIWCSGSTTRPAW